MTIKTWNWTSSAINIWIWCPSILCAIATFVHLAVGSRDTGLLAVMSFCFLQVGVVLSLLRARVEALASSGSSNSPGAADVPGA